MRDLKPVASGVASLFVLVSVSSARANLVVDGGFEQDASGNYSAASYPFPLGPSTFGPWTVNNGFVYVDGFAIQSHSGTSALNLTPGLFASNVSQSLPTVLGETYQLTFFAAAHSANTFLVDWNGIAVTGAPTILPDTIPQGAYDFTGDYRRYSFDLTATGTSSVLAFGGTNPDTPGMGPNVIMIDDVSVTAVPEPATWALMLVGFAGLGAISRMARRRLAIA